MKIISGKGARKGGWGGSEERGLKAGIHMKVVFWLGIMFFMQISRVRFKQSRISMLISHIYVLGCFVNFVVILRYI